MDSPVKKLIFNAADKENQPLNDAIIATLGDDVDHKKPLVEEVKKDEKAVVPVAKPEEMDEPLLQDNPQRFVLFPIKYHEVRDAFSRVKWFPLLSIPLTRLQ